MRFEPTPKSLMYATAAAVSASLAFAFATAAPAKADQTYYVPVDKTWTVRGHGYGHGHGMSQWGAQGAATDGLSHRQIIDFYYPGTTWATAQGNLRVLVSADTTSDVQVRPTAGLRVRDLSSGDAWRLPAGGSADRWRLTPTSDGRTAVQSHTDAGWKRWRPPSGPATLPADAQFEAGGPITLLVPGGGDVTGVAYRGALRAAVPYAGATVRDTVNVVSLDQYVRGVVAFEMPPSWKQQALRAQAVAARTFGAWLRSQNPKRYWQACDTTSCQVYGGVAAEQPSTDEAVNATAGEILTFRGKPAMTQFSASSGGWTAEGGTPYLVAKRDPYDDTAGNDNHDWSVEVSAAALEDAHPEIGRLVALRVTKRDGNGEWRGRVRQIVLDGTRGTAFLSGDDFRWAYGLKSTWFSIAPTPIIERWRALGGEKSPLGAPRSGEYAVAKGAAQDFRHGRIYWSKKTGARDMRGPILRKYRDYGGPSSRVGWPATGTMPAFDGGHKVRLQRGKIYSTTRTGARVVFGPVQERWEQEGAAAGVLGYPVADVRPIATGARGRFEHGVITWDRATDSFTVRYR